MKRLSKWKMSLAAFCITALTLASTLIASPTYAAQRQSSGANSHRHAVVAFPSQPEWDKLKRTHKADGIFPAVQGSGNLTYYGGPVEHNPVSYLIFWGSSWTGTDATTASIIQNYFNDYNGTTFENVLTQYYDTNGNIYNTHTLGGVYFDSSTPLTDSTCTASTTIQDNSVQSEVNNAIATKGWPTDANNAVYYVYLPNGYTLNDGAGDCSASAPGGLYCAYHSENGWFAYGAMPYPGNGCTVSTSPNGNYAADSEVNLTSHEQAEAITDPYPGYAWLDSAGYEIGDKCAWDFSAGTTTLNNGGVFELQTEYSNADSTCVNSRPLGNDFSISSNTASLSIQQGSSGSATISTAVTSGSATTITLSASSSPAGPTVSFSPSSVTASGSSTATISVGTTVAAGTYFVKITGTSGSVSHSVNITLTVTPGNDFSMSATPGSLSILQGNSGTSTISTVVASGSASTVALSASVSPAGPTVSLSPTSVTAGGSSTLTVSVGASVTPGAYTVTVTGTEGSFTHSVIVTVNVTAPTDFSISANPGSLSILQGNSGTSTISTVATSGSASTVTLSASVSPAGPTVSLSPTSVTAGGSSTLTVSVGSSVAAGTYTVTIDGVEGSAAHSTTVTVTVTAPSDFSISASPSSLSILQGNSSTSTISTAVTSGSAGTVALSASVSPAGPTVSLSPTSVTAGGASTLTVAVGSSVAAGTYTVTVSGTEGSFTHSATVTVTVTTPPPPANDAVGSATTISTLPFNATETTTTATTVSSDPSSTCGIGQNSHSVWYRYTPSALSGVTLSTAGSSYNTVLAVWTGGPGAWHQIACNDDFGGSTTSQLSYLAYTGATYYIEVMSHGTTAGGALQFSATSYAPNNSVTGALTMSVPYNVTQDTTNATTDTTDPSPSCGAGGQNSHSVWYRYATTAMLGVTLNTASSNYDTVLAVWTGGPGSWHEIACNDNNGGSSTSLVNFSAYAGTTYYIEIMSYGTSAAGTMHMTASAYTPNDSSSSALTISSLPYSLTQNTTTATTDTTDPSPTCGVGQNSHSVWYLLTPAALLGVTLSTAYSNYDTELAVWTGGPGAWHQVTCNNNYGTSLTSQVSIWAHGGTTYYIEVMSYGTHAGGILHLSATDYVPNNSVSGAFAITTMPYNVTQYTSIATTDSTDPSPTCGVGKNTRSVWYRFTSPSLIGVLASTAGSNYDTELAVWTGGPGAWHQVTCDNNYGTSLTSRVSFWAHAGTTYYIEVMSYSTHPGGILDFSAVGYAPNNTASGAFNISTLPYSMIQNTVYATTDSTDPVCTCGVGQNTHSVWYRYKSSVQRTVTVSTAYSNYDTVVAIWTGGPGAWHQVTCDNNYGTSLTSRVSFVAHANITYYIEVMSYDTHTSGTLHMYVS